MPVGFVTSKLRLRRSTGTGDTVGEQQLGARGAGDNINMDCGGLERRTFLKGAVGAAGGVAGSVLFSTVAPASAHARRATGGLVAATQASVGRRYGAGPLPKVLRSQRALAGNAVTAGTLPITAGGTTFEMAQETRWLDDKHFGVGRWDGSMSIFEFETAPFDGPLMSVVVNDPAFQGVEMLTPLPGNVIATSNDAGSISLWQAPHGDWTQLRPLRVYPFNSSLGFATSGVAVTTTSATTLVVGHVNGYLSIWIYNEAAHTLTFRCSVNVQNPNPTNPFNDHTVEDVEVADSAAGVVVAGSEDGYVTMISLPSGTILSQTVFNPQAQRGINALQVNNNQLLVANCSVGPTDYNVWYYALDKSNWSITLLDKAALKIDASLPQVFNFDVIWGRYAGGSAWFASTEEGALWMGKPSDTALNPIGYEQLTGPLGSALAYRGGNLVMVAYDLYQFVTGG